MPVAKLVTAKMFIPPSAVSGDLKAEIVIVGAGPAGMALSLDLASNGKDVALLSSGTRAPDGLSQDLSRAVSVPSQHVDPSRLEARRFGGMSWSWGGRCVGLEPMDFTPRPELGLPGWPIGYKDLMGYGSDSARFLGIGRPKFFDDAHPEIHGLPVSLERWAANPAIHKVHEDLFSADTGPRTYLGLTCTGANIDSDGRVTSLIVRKPTGEAINFEASTFVLAAGGIETARLLLWFFEANGRRPPKWVGRGYMGHLKGQVIRLKLADTAFRFLNYRQGESCFTRRRLSISKDETIRNEFPNIGFTLDNPPMADASHGLSGLSLTYLALSTPGIRAQLLPKAMREYLTAAQSGKARRLRHICNVLKNPIAAASFCFAAWQGRRQVPVRPGSIEHGPGSWLGLTFSGEERPVFQNCIELTHELDKFSLPRIVINRTLHPKDLDGVIAANQLMAKKIKNAGLAETTLCAEKNALRQLIEASSGDGYHQIGTARMGVDRSESVTDADCRVHGIRNLFVAGSAVFPRSGQANPTFSIICLAYRLARFLRDRN